MTKSPWFLCGACGFANHPRLNQDTTKCENCGASSDHEHAAEYDPGAR